MVIDGHSLAFRAFYAVPVDNFVTPDGQHTNAVQGFLSMLLKLLREEKPDALAVTFDVSRHSFRTEEYPEYKGTRQDTPQEFRGQIEALKRVLDAMNIRWLEKPNYEADDLIASITSNATNENYQVLVVSGDRDTIQLVNENVTLLYPASRGVSELKRYTPDTVFERYGVDPAQYPEIAALVGEKSDNLPGVPRVGEKTAVKWLQEYGTLQQVIANAENISGKVGESLRENIDLVHRNRRLNELRRDVEIPLSTSDMLARGFTLQNVFDIFDELGFRALKTRLATFKSPWGPHPENGEHTQNTNTTKNADTQELFDTQLAGSKQPTTKNQAPQKTRDETQNKHTPEPANNEKIPYRKEYERALNLRHSTELLAAEQIRDWLESHAKTIALTIYPVPTTNAKYRVGVACGETLAEFIWRQGEQEYEFFENWLADAKKPKIMHDSKRRAKILREKQPAKQVPLAGVVSDTAVAAWLLKPDTRTLWLSDLTETFFDVKLAVPDEVAKTRTKQSEAMKLAALQAEQSAAIHAWYLQHVNSALLAKLREESFTELPENKTQKTVYKGAEELYTDLELPLIPVLQAMETRGVKADQPLLETLFTEFGARAAEHEETAFQALGHSVNLSSPAQLQQVLFNELGMPPTRRVQSGYTTDAKALAQLRTQHPHPFLDALLAHRDAIKLKQIVANLRESVAPDGRIHTQLLQTGTSTGRLSSADPNLQNIPSRTIEGRRLRAAFTKGINAATLLTADYSQIEMRIMAHLSEDAGLIDAFARGEDLHNYVGSRIFSVPPENVTGEMRTKVKAMSYGLVYGLGAFGLARQLQISQHEAKQLIDDYYTRFGGVRDYLQTVVETARQNGYTQTVLGRRRYFTQLDSINQRQRQAEERAALNAPIQGSAADIIKIAMIRIEEKIAAQKMRSQMILQIHDELLFDVAPGENKKLRELVQHELANAYTLRVPLEVQFGEGENWLTAAH